MIFQRKKKLIIKDKALEDALLDAMESDGYMILITRLKGDTLFHTQSRHQFRDGDIMPSLDEMAKLLEVDTKK